jgi:hypothetical protein
MDLPSVQSKITEIEGDLFHAPDGAALIREDTLWSQCGTVTDLLDRRLQLPRVLGQGHRDGFQKQGTPIP